MMTIPDNPNTERYFIDCCRTKLMNEYLPKIKACLEPLPDEDLWWRAHETNNSIGNLVLHLGGNIRQWVVHHLGGNEFRRDREKEFLQRALIRKADLLVYLRSAVHDTDTDTVLARFPAGNLHTLYTIKNYSVTGLEAILHITEHFSYHVGQIVYITKLRSGKDLKFYSF